MFSSQGSETKKLEKEFSNIEKDLMNDLLSAGENKKEGSSQVSLGLNDGQSRIVINKHITKLFCDVKNGIIARILAKDLDDNIKELILDEFKTTDREIEIYTQILEQVGNQYVPENHKEWLSKILLSPVIVGIEFEIERGARLRYQIQKLVKKSKEGES